MQVYKASWCAFHARGKCTRGTNCSFAHSHSELRKLPDLRKTKICNGFLAGTCQKPDCAYAHGFQELRDFPGKKGLCRLFREGRCIHGARCKYAHALNELQVGYVFDNDHLQHPNVPNTLSEQSTIDSKNPYNMSSSVQQAMFHHSPSLFFNSQKDNVESPQNSSLLLASRSICSPNSMKDRINHSFFSMNTDPEALLKSLTSPIGSDVSNISMCHIFEPRKYIQVQGDTGNYYENSAKMYENNNKIETSQMFEKDPMYERKQMFEKNAMYEKNIMYQSNALLSKEYDQPPEYKKGKGAFSNIPGLASLAIMQKQNEKKDMSDIWQSELSQNFHAKLRQATTLDYTLREDFYKAELANASLQQTPSPNGAYEGNDYKMQNCAQQGSIWLPSSGQDNGLKPPFFETNAYKHPMPPPGLFPQHIPNVLDLLPSFLSSEACEELAFSPSPQGFDNNNQTGYSNCFYQTNDLVSDMGALNINKTHEHLSSMPKTSSAAFKSNGGLSHNKLLESFGSSPRSMDCKDTTSDNSPKDVLGEYRAMNNNCNDIAKQLYANSMPEELYKGSNLDQIKGEETTGIASCH